MVRELREVRRSTRMNTRIGLIAGLALVSSIIYGCGKKDDGPAQVAPTACPAGYVPASPGVQYPNQQYPGGYQQYPGGYQQYPGGYQQYPGGYQQYPGGYQQYPGGYQQYPQQQYPGQYPQYGQQYPGGYNQYPGGYNSAYPNCVPVTQQPGTGTGTGTGAGGVTPPAGGTLGTIPAGIRLTSSITVTNLKQFNRFLHENSQCKTGKLVGLAAECNNYAKHGGAIEITGNGSSAMTVVGAGPYKGISNPNGWVAVNANMQYFTVNGGNGFELRAQGAGGTYGYSSILAIRGNSALNGQPIQVVLSYRAQNQSSFVEFGRATLEARQ
jgi:hypothetical protein